MASKKYWLEFWKKSDMVNKTNAHEKVGRTINGIPIEEKEWQKVLYDLESHLALSKKDDVLDIGAGSGVISIPFSKKVKKVIAIDVSAKLLKEMEGVKNIETMEADIREVNFDPNSFDKIIIYFAIQHFTEEESVHLIKKIYSWLKPNGIFYLGDIPCNEHKFVFFNTAQRQNAYFDSLINASPIIGTWFQRDFFLHLSNYVGFNFVQVIDQPENFMNAHYRFDVKFIK